MQRQTETAQRQLEQSERSWLTVKVTPDSGFRFTDDGGIKIDFRPHIKNVGNSVATDVVFIGTLFLRNPDDGNKFFDESVERQNEICDKAAKAPLATGKRSGGLELFIFPNDTDESLAHGFDISKSEIEANKKAVVIKSGTAALIFPILVGCVDYRYATAIQHHQTRFMYQVLWHDRTIPPNFVSDVAIKVGRSVDTGDVILEKWPFGRGFYAY